MHLLARDNPCRTNYPQMLPSVLLPSVLLSGASRSSSAQLLCAEVSFGAGASTPASLRCSAVIGAGAAVNGS